MSDPEMGSALLLFGPSRVVRELRAFCIPELLVHWRLTAQQAAGNAAGACCEPQPLPPPPPPPPALAVHPVPGGLLAQLNLATDRDEQLLTAAAQRCTLLIAALRPLAAATSLEAAAAAALECVPPGTAQRHPLRTLCLDSGSARAPAERSMQQQLQQLGLGCAPDPAATRLWCIQHSAGWPLGCAAGQQQEQQTHYLLGLQLAAGAALSAAALDRKLGPTAMLPELAAVSCSLAAVRAGSIVLDPFCGSGSLLAAAADVGAALAVGSDIDATHFVSSCNGGNGSLGSCEQLSSGLEAAAVLLQADVACLRELLPAAVVDAIVTDLPYGYRTHVAVDAAAAGSTASVDAALAAVQQQESWQHLLAVLLQLASHALVPGGRLVAWMPLQQADGSSGKNLGSSELQAGGAAGSFDEAATAWQQQQLEEQGQQHGLRLLQLLPELRQGGYPRAAAVFELQPGSGTSAASASDPVSRRRRQLMAALEAAAADGAPVFNLHSALQREEQPGRKLRAGGAAAAANTASQGPESQAAPCPAAVEQRALHYQQVRGASKGAAIDVWRAAWLGDTAAIAEYAAAGGDVNARDRKGQSALQFAAGYGREAAVQLLLQLGGDPSAAGDRSGMAALHRAAARNHAGTLGMLLAAGADCCQRSAAGQTPLHYASQFGHEPAVRLLLEHLAATEQQAGIASGGSGAVNSCSAPARTLAVHLALADAAGLAPLHLAAQWGMAGVAELLLEAGADANQQSACEQQLTPAHLAARWGHAAVLQVLQRHGGDLRRRSGARGWTPLDEAREWRRQACIDMLQGLEAEGNA